jgi:hypothetical protein
VEGTEPKGGEYRVKRPQQLHIVRLSPDTYALIEEEARREEEQRGGRVNRSMIAERRIKEAYEHSQRLETPT